MKHRTFQNSITLLSLLALLAMPSLARAQAPQTPHLTTAGQSVDPNSVARRQAVNRIIRALMTGNRAAFRRMVTRRILARHAQDFDQWFGIWREAALRGPVAMQSIRLAREGGVLKLDEN